jgi:hypothetical protein
MKTRPPVHEFVRQFLQEPLGPDPLERMLQYWELRAEFAIGEYRGAVRRVARRDLKLAAELRQLLEAIRDATVKKADAAAVSIWEPATLANKTSRIGGKDPEIPTINGEIRLRDLPIAASHPSLHAVAAVGKIQEVAQAREVDELARRRAQNVPGPEAGKSLRKAEEMARRRRRGAG